MPLRYRAPYVPRTLKAPAARAAAVPRGGGRGAIAPGGIDTSSTGNVGGDIVKAIMNAQQVQRQNAVANQILNTQMAPRAGLVAAGVNPQTGVPNVIPRGLPITGTPPQTGGLGELQMRQQVTSANLVDQLNQAKIAAQVALANQRMGRTGAVGGGGGGSAARWKQYGTGGQPGTVGGAPGGKAGKPAAYVAGSGDWRNDPATDNFNQIRTDFDNIYGKGAYDTYSRNLGNVQDDGAGNLVLKDQSGKVTFSIPKNDAPTWIQRTNAARVRGGMDPLGNPPEGVNPSSGQPGGSQANPIAVGPQDNLLLRSLKMGTWMQGPDGSVRQKLPPGQQQPAQAAPPATKPTTATDQAGAANVAAAVPPPPPDQSTQAADQARVAAALPQVQQPAVSPLMTPQMNQMMAGMQPPPPPPNVASPDQSGSLPNQQIASANVSPMQAQNSYLQSLGLGAGAGQLYPTGDIFS